MLGRETFADEVVWDGRLAGADRPRRARRPPTGGHRGPDRGRAAAVLGGGELLPVGGRAAEDGGWRVSAATAGAGVRRPAPGAPVRPGAGAARGRRAPAGCPCGSTPRTRWTSRCSDGRVRAVWAVGAVRHVLGEADLPADGELEIRLLPDETHSFFLGRGPDIVVAGVVDGGGFTELGRVDGRYLSTEVAGGMTGRMVGVVCRPTAASSSAPSSTSARTTRRPSRDRRPRRPAQRLRGAHRAPRVGAAADPAQPAPRPDRPGRRGGVARAVAAGGRARTPLPRSSATSWRTAWSISWRWPMRWTWTSWTTP